MIKITYSFKKNELNKLKKEENKTMNENVKKVFEMLGVEPNEKFEIKNNLNCHRNGKTYFINEQLKIEDNEGSHTPIILSKLLNGDFKIIKIPKDPSFEELMNFKPKKDEFYHYVDIRNEVATIINTGQDFDIETIKYNIVYPTREMAERKKSIKNKYKELGHTFTIQEWQNKDIEKWTLLINHSTKKVVVVNCYNFGYSKYEFSSKELGEQFIKFLGSTQQEQYENYCLYL